MPSTRSPGEPVLPFNPELTLTFRKMNNLHNLANVGDEINCQPPQPVNAHNQVIVENPGEGAMRRWPPAIRTQEYYMGNANIADSDRPLVLPPLPQCHSFVVTSSLMQMLTTRGLFFEATIWGSILSHPQAEVGVQELCREVVLRHGCHRVRVFPLSLTGGHNLVCWVSL